MSRYMHRKNLGHDTALATVGISGGKPRMGVKELVRAQSQKQTTRKKRKKERKNIHKTIYEYYSYIILCMYILHIYI